MVERGEEVIIPNGEFIIKENEDHNKAYKRGETIFDKYEDVIKKYPQYKEDINSILISEGHSDLIVEL